MLNRFEGKVIAIGGGAGGIGGATSRRLAEEGATVIVGDINLSDAEQVAADIAAKGGRARPFKLDIGDEDSVKALVEVAVAEFGGLDGFFANALDASLRDDDIDPTTMDMATYDAFMHVNMRSYFLCTRHAVPRIIERGGGCMLYTSSGAAYVGMDTKPLYAMAKSGIHALARHVASRFGKRGVRGNVIAPGLMLHPAVLATMGQEFIDGVMERVKTPRLGTPEDIAAMAALLLSDEGQFVTGQVISVDGGNTMRA